MERIKREIISLMYEYNVNADETIEELAEDIADIVKEKYSVCHECGSELPNLYDSVKSRCDLINDECINQQMGYIPHRTIQEYMCEILDLIQLKGKKK